MQRHRVRVAGRLRLSEDDLLLGDTHGIDEHRVLLGLALLLAPGVTAKNSSGSMVRTARRASG